MSALKTERPKGLQVKVEGSTPVAPPPPSPTIDVDSLLAATAKPAAAKVAKPRVSSNDQIDQLAQEYLKFKADADAAKKMADIRRDDVVALVRPGFYDACAKGGKSLSSIQVGKVAVTFTCNYSGIPLGEKNNLQEVFGDEYDRYFREETELTIKTTDVGAVVKELVSKLGIEFFKEHFVTKQVIKVNAILHDDINTNPVVRAQVQPLIEGGVIKPYSPSIKLA